MDAHDKLQQIHELLIDQVLEDLEAGDPCARTMAVALLKHNNIQVVVQQNSIMEKLADKLNFSAMNEKVVQLPVRKNPA
jgi:hypothetical protein